MRPTKRVLALLRRVCIEVASAATSCWPLEYECRRRSLTLTSPLDGHCSAVAITVRGMFGGDIVGGTVKGTRHFWNRLPDGREVDLTSCQFGGDGYSPLARGRRVAESRYTPVVWRFLVFADRVREALTAAPPPQKARAKPRGRRCKVK